MIFVSFVLNLPWTLLALLGALISEPRGITLCHKPGALIISVRSFWWLEHLPGHKGVRAATLGNVILVGPQQLTGDIEHELVHVEQYLRAPFIQPFLYTYESLRHGYRHNKYETAAYKRAGNTYLER